MTIRSFGLSARRKPHLSEAVDGQTRISETSGLGMEKPVWGKHQDYQAILDNFKKYVEKQ